MSAYPELEYVDEHLYHSKRQARASGTGLYVSKDGRHYVVTETNLLSPRVEKPSHRDAVYLGHVRCKFVRSISKNYGYQHMHLYFDGEREAVDYATSDGKRLRITSACLAPREPLSVGERYLGLHLCRRL